MFKNILYTPRDKEILNLLNKIKCISTSTLSKIISPDTQIKTFSQRLLQLKNNKLIDNINNSTWEQVFCLNYSKQKKKFIEDIIEGKIIKSNIKITHQLYHHEKLIWDWFNYILKTIKNKWINYDISKIISQYEIQEYFSKEKEKINWYNINNFMIPDLLIPLNKEKNILLEIELNNTYNKFKQKMSWYYNMLLRIENKENLSHYFYWKSIILFIFVYQYKIERYKKIIDESWILKLGNIKVSLIKLEDIVW